MLELWYATLLLASVTVGPNGASVRAGCENSDEVVAKVAGGTPVDVRFAMGGFSEPCYKVSIAANGSQITGYVPASALAGLETFAEEIKNAPAIHTPVPKPQTGGAQAPHRNEIAVGHFALRPEKGELDQDLATRLAAVMDRENARVSAALGCRAERQITAHIQIGESYAAEPGAGEWTSGHYDGSLRIAIPASFEITPATQRAIAHEAAHACAASLGSFSPWLQEAIADRLSGGDRKSTRLNSSHSSISYAVFCLK